MVKKLSELKNEDMLFIKNTGSGDIVLSKGQLVENVIDRILSKGSNISYIENEKVEFDL